MRYELKSGFSCFSFLIFVVALSFLPAGGVSARDVTVVVEDADLSLPLDGAAITLWTGEPVRCDDEGGAVIAVPDEGDVLIRIDYPGYEPQTVKISSQTAFYTITLRLDQSKLYENKELVFEAERGDTSGSRIGRSVALTEKQVAMASEIGLIEDVMSSVKLLPGVGYSGTYNALPSIRGGAPGDLTAVFDGFYIEEPYHWRGIASIFDPNMVKTASLSHGVFSARYGHTCSGVLEVASKHPSSKYAEFETSLSTGALNFMVSAPLNKSGGEDGGEGVTGGGAALFGRLTYWDGYTAFVWGVSNFVHALDPVKAIKKAPYIQNVGLSAYYRWAQNLETSLHGYVGGDGVELSYGQNSAAGNALGNSDSSYYFGWKNAISFILADITYNPVNNAAVKTTIGAGHSSRQESYLTMSEYIGRDSAPPYGPVRITSRVNDVETRSSTNVQLSSACDVQMTPAALASFGVEELFRQWNLTHESNLRSIQQDSAGHNVLGPVYIPEPKNGGLFSSCWGALEWKPEGKRYGAELGLRVTHLYFMTEDLNLNLKPSVEPRVNFDYRLPFDMKYLDAVTFTAGAGLFSSMDDIATEVDGKEGLAELRMMQSWTGIAGVKAEFPDGVSVSIEAYRKRLSGLSYRGSKEIDSKSGSIYFFDGYGYVNGVDVMLQKFGSGKYNGWISYSFNVTRHRNPAEEHWVAVIFPLKYYDWYYPEFHRFHNLNVVLNYAVSKRVSIYARTGYASGVPLAEHERMSYVLTFPSGGTAIRWVDYLRYVDSSRGAFSLPLDIKLSYLFFKADGRTQGQLYLALENTLILLLPKDKEKILDPYTGVYEELPMSGFELPVPMVSFGIKWSY
jgi:hypothetical protein